LVATGEGDVAAIDDFFDDVALRVTGRRFEDDSRLSHDDIPLRTRFLKARETLLQSNEHQAKEQASPFKHAIGGGSRSFGGLDPLNPFRFAEASFTPKSKAMVKLRLYIQALARHTGLTAR
jgi:hypothetical protein